mgnify:CR=1 FL=1
MARATPILGLSLCFVSFGLILAQESSNQSSTPTRTQPTTTQQRQPSGSQAPQVAQAIFLSGIVIYGDGSRATTAARVELLCDGVVRRQVNTMKGSFSMTVGGSMQSSAYLDASIEGQNDPFGSGGSSAGGSGFGGFSPGGLGGGGGPQMGTATHVDLTGCELQASQTGYQSENITLSHRRALDNPNVGTLILYKAGSIAGTITSVTTISAPKKARKGYKKALKEVRKKKANYQKAESELKKATDLYPQFSEAWNLLGQIRLQLKDEAGARQAFEQAAAGDPKYLNPQMALMELESKRQSWDQVSQWSKKVIELHPYKMKAHFYQGFANVQLGHFEQAAESFTKVRASARADQYPYAGYLLGLMLSKKGDFAGAAKELNHFLEVQPEAPEGDRIKALLSDWAERDLIKGAKP